MSNLHEFASDNEADASPTVTSFTQELFWQFVVLVLSNATRVNERLDALETASNENN